MVQVPEIWAGVECTVNRIGDNYLDQVDRTGHANRLDDLVRLAELGVRTVRYPVLWERAVRDMQDGYDWTWTDERLQTLRSLGIKPIAGLVHHGSGPKSTDLLDSEFPEKLAAYALGVAERYPWIADYTPVNEPLTTARFSCLYGHWYPHATDSLLFARALLIECRAVVLAMRSIRAVNSEARLVQTEDVGKTFSTSLLKYQADFENERRWLTFDLLSGRLTPQSEMWQYFSWLGIEEDELRWFIDHPCPPDLVGVNHYITSERFLDERTRRYPKNFHGGNGQHRYADVEAVRVCAGGTSGPKAILKEVWDRYGLPLAVTEAHLGCSREEQLRWLKEVWNAALQLRSEGVDIRAVTLWGAFGSFDWNNLLTDENGQYEPGLFDLRAPAPRPTALAKVVQRYTRGEEFDHPVMDTEGWWRRTDRFCYPPVKTGSSFNELSVNPPKARPILITGAAGTLGQAFARICNSRGLCNILLTRQQLDIANAESIKAALDQHEPWAVINAAGYVRVDEAETDVELCYRENVVGPRQLATECAARGVKFVTFSSDLVFDGQKGNAYLESDEPAPLNVYGRSKREAELLVLEQLHESLIVRSSAFFGPWDDCNFARNVIGALQRGEMFKVAEDVIVSPTYIPDLVNAVLDLMIDDESGVWHIASGGSVSWYDFAKMIATGAGYSESFIVGQPIESFGLRARRPVLTSLASERGSILPAFGDGLERFFSESNFGAQVLAMAGA